MAAFKKIVKWTVAILAVLLLVAGGLVGYAYWQFTKPGPLSKAEIVYIPKGSNVDKIASSLVKAKVIDNKFIFRLWVRVHGAHKRMRHGEFKFPRAVSQKAAMNVLMFGKNVLYRFSVPEGLTTQQIVARLNKAPRLVGPVTLQLGEGELLPDTYFFVRGETRNQVAQRLRKAMRKTLAAAWAKRKPNLPFSTPRQALTLASIIEKETSKPSERRRIAGVFVNRLRKGMKLQTDPTVIYGITKGKGPLGRRLLRSDLKKKHPYNTYVITGLPPGPIANPGRGAIAAAVDPVKTKDLYFVADGSGGHAFAETYKQHQRNVAKWRKIRAKLERKKK